MRGKILNCLKAEYNKIFANDIITDLIKVLGCGVEVKSKSMKDMVAFNIDQLRWSKVIICTDADVDGFQIRTLILAMIYRLMPTLIEKGKVYIAESPLYEINSKDETWFAYNEQEKQDILSQLENSKFTIQRSKGLGENDADMMSLTAMNPRPAALSASTRPAPRKLPRYLISGSATISPAERAYRTRRRGIYRHGGCFVTA